MTALILSLLGQFWPVIVGALAVFGWGFHQRRAGAAAERAKQAKAEQRADDIDDAVQNDIGAMTPEQRREALRKWAR